MPDSDPVGGSPDPSPSATHGADGSPAAAPSRSEPAGESTAAGSTPSPTVLDSGPGKGWHPAHYQRFQEVTRTNREMKARLAQVEQELGQRQSQVAALAGVGRQPDVDPDEAAILNWLHAKFPALQHFTGDRADKLVSVLERFDEVQSFLTEQSTLSGHGTLRTLHERAKDLFGGSLTDGQKDKLNVTFVRWIERDEERSRRYNESMDPALIDEFLEHEWRADVIEPVRRSAVTATAAAANRLRRLPQAGGEGITAGGPKPKEKPKTIKEAAQRAWETFTAE